MTVVLDAPDDAEQNQNRKNDHVMDVRKFRS